MSTRKSGKFIQLEWECPNCDARNPGPAQSCESCGAPQPENVEFLAPAERKYVTDEKSLERAMAGADIYCAFCETRNPATQVECIQCGADLAEGKKRASGGEVRRRAAETHLPCPSCGAENGSSSHTCVQCGSPLMPETSFAASTTPKMMAGTQASVKPVSKGKVGWIVGALLFLLICCIGIVSFLALAPSKTVQGTVEQVHWETRVTLEEEKEVHYDDRIGSPPSDAYDVSCRTEREEVCTERTVDQGNGFAEVVEDCDTQSREYCSYSVMEWQTVETFTLDGYDYAPQYASPSLGAQQRLGNSSVDYLVTFSTSEGAIDYSVNNLDEFRLYQVGSNWTLTLNRLGGIISVER